MSTNMKEEEKNAASAKLPPKLDNLHPDPSNTNTNQNVKHKSK